MDGSPILGAHHERADTPWEAGGRWPRGCYLTLALLLTICMPASVQLGRMPESSPPTLPGHGEWTPLHLGGWIDTGLILFSVGAALVQERCCHSLCMLRVLR